MYPQIGDVLRIAVYYPAGKLASDNVASDKHPLWGLVDDRNWRRKTDGNALYISGGKGEWVDEVHKASRLFRLYMNEQDNFEIALPDEWPDEVCVFMAQRRLAE